MMSNHGGTTLEAGMLEVHLGGIWELPGKHLGGIWEVSGGSGGHGKPETGLEEEVAFSIELFLYFLARPSVSCSVWRGEAHDCM